MTVVSLFDRDQLSAETKRVIPEPANSNNETATIIELVRNKDIAHGVKPNTVFKQAKAMLQTFGVDFNDPKVQSDFKVVTFLMQGMLDRSIEPTSDRCVMLNSLRMMLAYEEPLPNDTQELFGDLLGRLD